MSLTLFAENLESIPSVAKQILEYASPHKKFVFYAEMGVGKTTFVKYLINNFQIEKKLQITEVTSPTFNLLNEYELNKYPHVYQADF